MPKGGVENIGNIKKVRERQRERENEKKREIIELLEVSNSIF